MWPCRTQSDEALEGQPVGELQVLLFLVLMMGVGLGSAAAAWATRLSKDEARWMELGKQTFSGMAVQYRPDTTTSAPMEPPQTS